MTKLTRLALTMGLSLLLTGCGQPTLAEPSAVEVPTSRDLALDARRADRLGLPIMLEFAAPWCPYCEQLEELVLRPMLRNPDTHRQVLIRKLNLASALSLTDFDGRATEAGLLAERYGVNLTPTLLFLGPDGRELSERIVGIYSLDFFGGLVDARIAEARARLR